MKLYKKEGKVFIEHEESFYVSELEWDVLVNHTHLFQYLLKHLSDCKKINGIDAMDGWEAPIGSQELWAAGVTYLRSKEAREKNPRRVGRKLYDKVYDAIRPELFLNHCPIGFQEAEPSSISAGIQPGMFLSLN